MVNRVILTGYLGADPEIKEMPSGDAVANVRLASTDRYRDKASGAMKETTEWHRLVLFGRLAAVANSYLVKGSRVYVEGRLRTRKWTPADGQDKYVTEIVVEHLEMLGGSRGLASQTPDANPGAEHDAWAEDYDRAASASERSAADASVSS